MATALPPKETLPHLIRRALEQQRDETLVERVDGVWKATSSSELLERAENVACAIRGAGLAAGDRVALVAHDCVDWIVCDFATFFAGCVVVPIYPTQALDHTAYILEHSAARLVFADSAATVEHLRESGASLPQTVVFDSGGADSLTVFEAIGARIRAEHCELPATYEATSHPDDLAVLIYTSGTTGNPKGVMLSHDNLSFNAQSTLEYGLEELTPDSNVISVLPFSHVYEHLFIYVYLLAGVRYCLCHDPNALLEDLRDVRPVAITSVPRIFDRVLAGVQGQAMKHGGLQAKLVPWALEVGRETMHQETFGGGASAMQKMKYAIAKKLVLEKVRARLGLDRIRMMASGSAALHVDVAMTFLGMGIPIMQGYGLTETSPVITASHLGANEYGASGKPIHGVEVRIAPDGEILTRGRHVMQGYYKDPEATAQMIEDGWLHTGDIGEIDEKGFLRITDRKREVFKTDTGKWVSPARIEAALKRSIYIAQAMVVGSSRPYPIALICPNWDLLRLELQIPGDAPAAELASRPDVREYLVRESRTHTSDLASYEQIRHIVVLPREFSVESGELSPSMKIKRRVVEKGYASEIDRAYGAAQREHVATS